MKKVWLAAVCPFFFFLKLSSSLSSRHFRLQRKVCPQMRRDEKEDAGLKTIKREGTKSGGYTGSASMASSFIDKLDPPFKL